MEILSELSSSDWAAWVQAIGTILAVLAAIWISRHQGVLTRKRDEKARADGLRSCWAAVRAEVEVCGLMADAYLAPPLIMAPSYRWPTVVYDKILHELLLAARLNTEETRALLTFFSNVDAVNRGFDLAQQINIQITNSQERQERLKRQFEVNRSRIEKHLQTGGDMYQAAIAVIDRHAAALYLSADCGARLSRG